MTKRQEKRRRRDFDSLQPESQQLIAFVCMASPEARWYGENKALGFPKPKPRAKHIAVLALAGAATWFWIRIALAVWVGV